MSEPIDCKSNDGITIDMIDAIMAMAAVLRDRYLNFPEVQEALKDLAHDQDLEYLLEKGRKLSDDQ